MKNHLQMFLFWLFLHIVDVIIASLLVELVLNIICIVQTEKKTV